MLKLKSTAVNIFVHCADMLWQCPSHGISIGIANRASVLPLQKALGGVLRFAAQQVRAPQNSNFRTELLLELFKFK